MAPLKNYNPFAMDNDSYAKTGTIDEADDGRSIDSKRLALITS